MFSVRLWAVPGWESIHWEPSVIKGRGARVIYGAWDLEDRSVFHLLNFSALLWLLAYVSAPSISRIIFFQLIMFDYVCFCSLRRHLGLGALKHR